MFNMEFHPPTFRSATVLLGLLMCTTAFQAQEPRIGTSVGDLAPELVLQSLEGDQVKLSDLRGQLVLVDFWGDLWVRRGMNHVGMSLFADGFFRWQLEQCHNAASDVHFITGKDTQGFRMVDEWFENHSH